MPKKEKSFHRENDEIIITLVETYGTKESLQKDLAILEGERTKLDSEIVKVQDLIALFPNI